MNFLRVILIILFSFQFTGLNANTSGTGRAISLKIFLGKVNENNSANAYTDAIRYLAGITEIRGFALDEERQDIILFGAVEEGKPPILTEDLIIALRNINYEYATKEGNTRYYSYPSCTIEMDPKVIAQLNEVASRLSSIGSKDALRRLISDWHQSCRQNQQAEVFGVPYNSTFAKTMVEADYHMKSITNGTDSINIEGLESMVERQFNRRVAAFEQGGGAGSQSLLLNRFWFYPDDVSYTDNEDIVSLDECSIKLLTEQEYLSESGQIEQSGRANEMAQDFADAFTEKFDLIKQKRPVYNELQNIYRLFALAKMMEHKELPVYAENILADLREKYKTEDISHPSELPGKSVVKYEEFEKKTERGSMVYSIFVPSCGGVSMEMEVDRQNIDKLPSRSLQLERERVLKKRPDEEKLFWDYQLPE